MKPANRVSEAELHGYADGRLGPDRAREVALWLDDHPIEALRVGSWRAQNEAIRRAFPTPARERLTISMRNMEPAPAAPAPTPNVVAYRMRQRRRRALATAMAFATGAVAATVIAIAVHRMGLDTRREAAIPVEIVTASPEFARTAVAAWATYAHDRSRPVEIGAKDLPALTAWISERTGLAVPPHVGGARLIGGRVLPGRAEPAAFLLYETGDSERIALFAERLSSGENAGAEQDGVRAVVWRTKSHEFALVGRLPDARLRNLAAAFTEATRRP